MSQAFYESTSLSSRRVPPRSPGLTPPPLNISWICFSAFKSRAYQPPRNELLCPFFLPRLFFTLRDHQPAAPPLIFRPPVHHFGQHMKALWLLNHRPLLKHTRLSCLARRGPGFLKVAQSFIMLPGLMCRAIVGMGTK